jgi:putative ABC transport system substrate-binding protein
LKTIGIVEVAALAARAAVMPVDPVKFRLITSFSKPGQNVTGVASLGKVLIAKQLEVLHELVPRAHSIAFLVNPNNAVAGLDTSDAQSAAETLGKKLIVFEAGTKDELDKTPCYSCDLLFKRLPGRRWPDELWHQSC